MKSISKPIWLFEPAGVLFPYSNNATGWRSAKATVDIQDTMGNFYRANYAVELAKKIRELINLGVVDVWWATSWVNNADKLEAILGFPKLPRAFPRCVGAGISEKANAAERILNSGRRLIWADSVAIPQWGSLFDLMTKDDRALLIRPDSHRGLAYSDVGRIRGFINTGMKTSIVC